MVFVELHFALSFRTMRERGRLYVKNMILVTIAGIIINSRTLFAFSSELGGFYYTRLNLS